MNEAFAAVSLNVARILGFDEELVNVNGGAVALGHPIGASGARIVLTLAHEMRRRGVDLGGAAICGGGGQGDALVLGASEMADLERFQLPPELEEFRSLVRAIAEEKIAPRAEEIDRTDEWPEDLFRVLVDNELTGVGYPEEYGGSGGGSLAFGVLVEELSRVAAGLALAPAVSKLGVIPLMLAGTEEQRKQMIEGIVKGDVLMSYALTEAGSGSDAAAMTTRYERDGDGFVITGTKRFITGAGVSHAYVVFATRDPAERAAGISAFLVMADDPGVSFGRKEDKMGIRGSPTREVVLERARIPADQLIGPRARASRSRWRRWTTRGR